MKDLFKQQKVEKTMDCRVYFGGCQQTGTYVNLYGEVCGKTFETVG